MKNQSNSRRTTPGFTLLEILIVLVIIGIVITFALLATGNFDQDKKLKAFVDRVAQTISLLEQQAILEPSIIGIQVKDNKMRFYRYQVARKQKSQWQLITDDKLLNQLSLTTATISVESVAEKDTETTDKIHPQIILYPNGEFTAFSIHISDEKNSVTWTIQGDQQGEISTTKLTQ